MKLEPAFAGFGDLVGARHQVDPFVLQLSGVADASSFRGLEILNRTREPELSWESARPWTYRTDGTDQPLGRTTFIPSDLLTVVEGKLALVMSNYEAARLGLLPGDVLEVRQSFFTGSETKTSTPTTVEIDAKRSERVDFSGFPINRFGLAGIVGEPFVLSLVR